MKAKEARDFIKSEAGARELERSGMCAQKVSKVMGTRVFAVCTGTDDPREITQWGSCVLLNIKGRIFVATAAHVLDECIKTGHQIHLYGGGIYKLEGLAFIRADDTKIEKTKVVVDAAVFEIISPVPSALVARAFTEDMLSDPGVGEIHMLCGFAVSNTVEDYQKTLFGLTFVPTSLLGALLVSPGKIAAINLGTRTVNNANLGFSYYGIHMQDSEVRLSPSFKGMSGGPVLRLRGAPVNMDAPVAEQVEITLTSIIVEYRKRALNDPPMIICSNINLHLAMILDILDGQEQVRYSWKATRISSLHSFNEEDGSALHVVKTRNKSS